MRPGHRVFSLSLLTAVLLVPIGTAAPVSATTCPTITVSPPSGSTLADGQLNQPYSATITASGATTSAYYWQSTGGSVPGLDWNPKGQGGNTLTISGTPTQVGAYRLMFGVQDGAPGVLANCPGASASYNLNIPSADVAVSQSASGAQKTGQELDYNIRVGNNGPDFPAHNVALVDTLPASVTFKSASWTFDDGSGTGTCSRSGVTITCDVGTLGLSQLGQAYSATAKIAVVPTQSGTITDTAQVSATEYDPSTANNHASLDTDISPATADLDVGVLGPDQLVAGGSAGSYKINVHNAGPDPAPNVTLGVSFPRSPDFIFKFATGPCSSVLVRRSHDFIVCTWSSLLSGEEHTITLRGGFSSFDAGTETIRAKVSSRGIVDPNPDNDVDSTDTAIIMRADLSVHPELVRRDGHLELGAVVANAGPSVARAFKVTIIWSGPMKVQTVGDGCQQISDGLVCSHSYVVVGDKFSFPATRMRELSAGDVKVTAQVRGTTHDPDLSNNKDSIERTL